MDSIPGPRGLLQIPPLPAQGMGKYKPSHLKGRPSVCTRHAIHIPLATTVTRLHLGAKEGDAV